MNMKQNNDQPPCRMMERALQEVASGHARGIRRWWAAAHAAKCCRCGTFLSRMQVTIETLRSTGAQGNPPEAMDRLRQQIRELEGQGQ